MPKKDNTKKRTAKKKGSGKGFVRLAGKDLNIKNKLEREITKIKGIGYTMSRVLMNILEKELGIKKDFMVKDLTEEQIEKIEAILDKLSDYEYPIYLKNRRSDPETGKNLHLTTNDLKFKESKDIENMKEMYTWKGYRHAYGQKVRGQKTKNTGRSGMSVGVIRKSQQQKQQPGKK